MASPDISCFLTVKKSATLAEMYDMFWAHGESKTLKVKGKTFNMAFPRSEFVNESNTTLYSNTKNTKELMINCFECDMAKMGKMMGGPVFQEMGSMLWDMNPATDLKIRLPEPTGAICDIIAFADLKPGTNVEEYSKLFWAHANGTRLTCKGKTYDMEFSRGSMCDEKRTALYVNSKNPTQIAITCYDCDVAKLGAMMGGPKFKEMADAMWTMTGMQYMMSPPRPTLFYGTWKINESARVPCTTYFGSMNKEMDRADAGPVNVMGRWIDTASSTGAFICEATSVADVHDWLYNWVPMATLTIKPILDDNTAREIILGEKPPYMVDYSHVGDEALPGESLYLINYRFYENCKVEGNKIFANLTEEQDKADCGKCRSLGRWHDLGNGTGVAIAAAKSEVDLYKWAFNWTAMCEVEFTPMITDAVARKIVRGKPDYEKKLAAVKAQMTPAPQPKKRGWFF